ncbi:MAG: carboxypeptidase regulatory-like domain-containing protein [Deltaproteobacteria bacterium]|nr:MAG: carboxypeptidase regulatory-like domain-containing protein [Deltaproteobacteria bacterium]
MRHSSPRPCRSRVSTLLVVTVAGLLLLPSCRSDDDGADCPPGERERGGVCVPFGGDPGGDPGPPGEASDVADGTSGLDVSESPSVEEDTTSGRSSEDPLWSGDLPSETSPNPQPGRCPADQPATTLTGRVTIPSGALPLPDVTVYVPASDPLPITPGAQCVPCGEEITGNPIVLTETDNQGRFILRNVPEGDNIPLVIQVGKWRRIVNVPRVEPCTVTALPQDLTRLPRNQSEGDIPQFAVTTGGCDAMECLLRKIGIDDSEFTPEAGGGRVHLFAGNAGTRRYAPSMNGGASFTSAASWWSNENNLMPYDIVVMSCECNEGTSSKPLSATTAMRNFANAGGRMFLSHYHYYWLRGGPDDFQSVATWNNFGENIRSPAMGTIDRDFDKGQQMADWMFENEIVDTFGRFEIRDVRASVQTLNEDIATRWAWITPQCLNLPFIPCPPPVEEQPQYISFNTPIGAQPDDQCGRVVHSDIHVSGGDRSSDGSRDGSTEVFFPDGCRTSELTAQEAALVFMLFDLARCIVPDKI